MEEIAKVLSNYGFPIAITIFLLVRMEKSINDLKDEIQRLIEKVTEFCERRRK